LKLKYTINKKPEGYEIITIEGLYIAGRFKTKENATNYMKGFKKWQEV